MFMLPKANYRFNIISKKIPVSVFFSPNIGEKKKKT